MNEVLGQWIERYTDMLNHPHVTSSPDLDAAAHQATPDPDVISLRSFLTVFI